MSDQKLIVFSAPSGAGKTTLVKHLLSNLPIISFSISCTTRAKRKGDEHARDYYFISIDEFKEKIKNNEFIEWEEVYENNFYGTLKTELTRIWGEKKQVIFDIDVEGGINIKKQFPNQTLAVFIQPPSIEELKRRLYTRGTESEEKLQIRIAKAKKEIALAKQFDKIIVNDDLEKAKKEALSLVSSFLSS